jgi:spore germination protein YaaH
MNLARSYHLRGFSVWVLGPEDPAIWDILKAEPKP